MKQQYTLLLTLVLCTACCGPIPDLRDLTELDADPPVITGIHVITGTRVRLDFNEECSFIGEPYITPGLKTGEIQSEETSIIIDFITPQAAGIRYHIDGSVRDGRGNSTDFILHFYGYNPDTPGILINEITTQGSGKHPDVVELITTTPGNCAGMCLYEGTESNWDEMFVLPPMAVQAGEFILIHFKPQGIAEEIDETSDKNVSGGYDAYPEAFDLWLPGGSGLSGNNGVISVYTSPHGTLADGILYSNRTSQSDEDYRGFGSLNVLSRAEELYTLGGWNISGDAIAPEDAINPDDSTATRSICRSSGSYDSDFAADWHITPTGGFTFGAINSDEEYIP